MPFLKRGRPENGMPAFATMAEGQRGVAIWKSTVYFLTPNNWLVALNANTGQELWQKNYTDSRKQYFWTAGAGVQSENRFGLCQLGRG